MSMAVADCGRACAVASTRSVLYRGLRLRHIRYTAFMGDGSDLSGVVELKAMYCESVELGQERFVDFFLTYEAGSFSGINQQRSCQKTKRD